MTMYLSEHINIFLRMRLTSDNLSNCGYKTSEFSYCLEKPTK